MSGGQVWVFGKGGGDSTGRRGQLTVMCIGGGRAKEEGSRDIKKEEERSPSTADISERNKSPPSPMTFSHLPHPLTSFSLLPRILSSLFTFSIVPLNTSLAASCAPCTIHACIYSQALLSILPPTSFLPPRDLRGVCGCCACLYRFP